jgi:magnesium-transporting ATPase (P-type)
VTRPNEKGEPSSQSIHINFLHVGDIVHLKYGMLIPVDGVVLSCNQLMTNEAAMTGESDERRKEKVDVCQERLREKGQIDYDKIDKTESHALPSSILLSGTSVAGGDGKMLTVMVGKKSALGEIMDKLTKRDGETPLQQKLEVIATEIGKIGTYAALLTIHVLLFRYFLDGILKRNIDLFGGESEYDRPFVKNFKQWVDYVVIGVAVIVVAVPEGLPLAVMISLAYSQGKMLKDANYVKKLAACEIMGGATNICSDKTGTLTLNQMKVANVWVGKDVALNTDQDENKKMKPLNAKDIFTDKHWEMISTAIACNVPEDYGATDKGMVDLLERCSASMSEI